MMRALFPLFMLAAIVAAGCGGGGGGSFIAAPTPTPAPATLATTAPLSSSTTTPVRFGAVSGAGGGTAISNATVTLPQTSGATNATLTMQATLPGGAAAPALRNLRGRQIIGGTNLNPLAYFVFSVRSTVAISSWPGFTVGFPTPITGTAYVAILDTSNPSNTWNVISAPLTASGNILTFPPNTFAPPALPLTLKAGVKYDFVILTATGVPPTVGAPTYCVTEGVSASNGTTLNVTDSSRLTDSSHKPAALLIYVQQQATAGPIAYNSGSWMDASGKFATSGAKPVPLPAACYSSTLASGVTKNPLVIPFNHAGRIYLVYATPAPDGSVPNPLSDVSAGGQPSDSEPYLYDKIEYGITTGTTSSVIDTTQVDFVGMPLEMQAVQSTSATPLPATTPASCPANPGPTTAPFGTAPALGTIVGVSECNFLAIFQTLTKDATFGKTYGELVMEKPWAVGASSVPFRAFNPAGAIADPSSPFNYNAFGDPAVTVPAGCSGTSPAWKQYGIVGCLLDYYKLHSQLYATSQVSGAGADGDNFCVSADNTTNFVFEATDIGTATSCISPVAKATSKYLPTNPFSIPAVLFTNPKVPNPNPGGAVPCNLGTVGQVFNASFGLGFVDSAVPGPSIPKATGKMFLTLDAFALWKGMILELNYGSAFLGGTHPLESTPPSFAKGVFKSPISNFYARTVHSYFNGNYAYAMSYDDGFSWYSGYGLISPGTISVRVNPIPAAGPYSPAGSRIALPTCGAFTADVGGYHV